MKIITSLEDNQIFVFGSNLQGIHGAGAARTALQWGAEPGKAYGRQGRTYAIATKDLPRGRCSVPLDSIQRQLELLNRYAEMYPDFQFLLTPVGTGYAGYTISQLESIMPAELQSNIICLWR